MATIRKRGKRWEAQVRIKGHASQSRSFATRVEAVSWSREAEAARAEASLDGPTIAQLLARYERELTPLKRGAEQERHKIAMLRRSSIADKTIGRLTAQQIVQYRDQRLSVVKGSTVRRELALLRHCIEIARKEWGLSLVNNVVGLVRFPPPGRARDVRLNPKEIDALWVAIESSKAWYIKPIITLAIETGMRRGEILSLKWQFINLQESLVQLPLTKNGSARTVPLSPAAGDCLAQLPVRDAQLVFPVSKYALRQTWVRVTKKAGISGFRFHDLRHEALSRLFELGLSVPEVQLIGGHKTISQLLRYVHPRPRQVAEKLRELRLAAWQSSS
jgi:integrase